jgi:hypothetical protein
MSQTGTPREPPAGPIERFAWDLRQVKAAAGNPTLEQIAERGKVSKAALSEATSGRKVPSEAILKAYLIGCKCPQPDIDAWVARRAKLKDDLPALLARAQERTAPVSLDGYVKRGTAWMVGACAVVTLACGGGLLGYQMGKATVAAPAATPPSPLAPHTGEDPERAGCTKDAQPVALARQPHGGTLLELIWSEACQANWGRITRDDDDLAGSAMTVEITGHFKDAPNPQIATADEQQIVNTPLMIVDPEDKVCVTGSWTVGGRTIESTEPACG